MMAKDNNHVFVIRVWQEPREIHNAVPIWRFMVEYVPTGDKCYLNDCKGILTFISSHVEGLGTRPSFYSRLIRRLKRWMQFSM